MESLVAGAYLRQVSDADIAQTCGIEANAVCKWVYQTTGNEVLANLAKLFVGWPLNLLITVVITWIVALVGRRMIRRGGRRVAERGTGPMPLSAARISTLTGVVASVFTVAVWTIAVISILANLGISLVPLLASAGVATAALGFGAQNIVKDFLAGFFMLAEGQFEIGDVIDVGEASGTVEAITLRRTVLRGADGTVWHVPNGVVTRVGNRSQQWSQAVLDVYVANDADVAQAEAVIAAATRDLVHQHPWDEIALAEPELLGVENMGPEGIVIRIIVKTAPGQHWRLLRALRPAVKAALDRAGIAPPPPAVVRAAPPAE